MKPPHRQDGRQGGLTLLETLIAMVVVGIGVGIFLKMQNFSWLSVRGNSNLMKAGQLIEKQVENTRMAISRDTLRYWPPMDTVFQDNGITLQQTIMDAHSPKDGAFLPNVKKLNLVAHWGKSELDTLKVSTYVSKRF